MFHLISDYIKGNITESLLATVYSLFTIFTMDVPNVINSWEEPIKVAGWLVITFLVGWRINQNRLKQKQETRKLRISNDLQQAELELKNDEVEFKITQDLEKISVFLDILEKESPLLIQKYPELHDPIQKMFSTLRRKYNEIKDNLNERLKRYDD